MTKGPQVQRQRARERADRDDEGSASMLLLLLLLLVVSIYCRVCDCVTTGPLTSPALIVSHWPSLITRPASTGNVSLSTSYQPSLQQYTQQTSCSLRHCLSVISSRRRHGNGI